MDKLPDCEHQWPNEPECAPAVHNTYYCPNCDLKWSDVWSCGCDDKCPGCDVDYTTLESVEIAPCACRYLKPRSMQSIKENMK